MVGSLLEGLCLSALIVALTAFALQIAQGADAVRAGRITPAEAIEVVEAWLRGI